jgi:hypothetical protein
LQTIEFEIKIEGWEVNSEEDIKFFVFDFTSLPFIGK